MVNNLLIFLSISVFLFSINNLRGKSEYPNLLAEFKIGPNKTNLEVEILFFGFNNLLILSNLI